MKKLILTLLVVLTTTAAWAVKTDRTPALITQSDGTQVTVIGFGDANFHWYTTTDGVLLYKEGTDFYIANIDVNGELTSSGILVHESAQRKGSEKTLVANQNKTAFYNSLKETTNKSGKRKIEPIGTGANGVAYFPHKDSPKAIVILAEFQDTLFHNTYDDTRAIFNSYLNAEGKPEGVEADKTVSSNYGSIRKYFSDMSGGKYTPQFDVYGPVKLSRELKYYGEGKDDYMSRFVPEVCQLADELIDYSQYDANNDGNVDLVYIIYAGYAASYKQNSTDCIWPKAGTIDGGTYDGKKVCRYGVHAELNGYPGAWSTGKFHRISGAGLFCHEFSHTMGLPDLYYTGSAPYDDCDMEYWDLMDLGEYTGNGYYPTAYTAWEREVMGWSTIETLTDKGQVVLKNIDEGGMAYRILNDAQTNGHEYFILQNIQKTGWNSRQYGHGMLITHVDYAKDYTNLFDYPNALRTHPRMTIVPADGLLISSYSIKEKEYPTQDDFIASLGGDPYPGTGNVTEIESFSVFTSDNDKNLLYKPIYNIKETDGVITFDFLETTTAIKTVETTDIQKGTDRIYTIDGRLVNTAKDQLPKGIYIIGKKKVVIK